MESDSPSIAFAATLAAPVDALVSFLLQMLDGCNRAAAMMPWKKPSPIVVPDDAAERRALVETHIRGAAATVTTAVTDKPQQRITVDALMLAGYCPAADGLARWIACDFDASDHGVKALRDPMHAARCWAERAEAAGLGGGLVVARSRGGLGRHGFLILPGPTPLEDAVLGAAGLAARAMRIANQDVADCDAKHAFETCDGGIAVLGQSGQVEIIPPSTNRTTVGWAMALPASGASAARGGGIIIDPYHTDETPLRLDRVPQCDLAAWQLHVSETRAALARRPKRPSPPPIHQSRPASRDPLARIDPRTRQYLDGRAAVGTRNASAFAATANLLGCGIDELEAMRLVMAGAAACGLPATEARAAFKSAAAVVSRNWRGA